MKMIRAIFSYSLVLVVGMAFLSTGAIGSINNCPNTLSGYWRLDEGSSGSYQDYVGTNSGACDGGCPSPTSEAVIGNGQLFDGINDGIRVPADSVMDWLRTDSFTIELWVQRETGTVTLEAFVGRADAGGLSWYIGINSSGQARAQLKAADGSGPALITGSKDIRSASIDPVWHHIALVRNAQTNQTILYVDGAQEAAQTFGAYTADFNSAAAPLTIGSWDDGNRLSGRLDEVAIYNEALDAATIKGHYYIARDYCSFYDSPIDVMALGDSITKGNYNPPGLPPEDEKIGYRLDLWEALGNNLYWFDYIGSQENGTGININFDDDHASFEGITDAQLFTLLATGENLSGDSTGQITPGAYLNTYPTEVILLHIGTNGMDPSPNDVEDILNEIDSYSKNITVLLARIIRRVGYDDTDLIAFNNNIESLANARIAQGDKILMVDMQTGAGLNYAIDDTAPYTSGDMYDSLHPNPSGYIKMADVWFTALETFLPQSDMPLFISTPSLETEKDVLYEYASDAEGPPKPTYSLISGPSGMTIDPASGLVQWTPDTYGQFDVSIRAANWTGEDQQQFTITVNSLPLAANDSYNGIAKGGSITISAAEGVLTNDTDENDPLSAILVSDVSHGTLIFNSDGSFQYTHDGSDTLSDMFTYKATDGTAETTPTTAALTITPDGDSKDSGGGGGGCFISVVH